MITVRTGRDVHYYSIVLTATVTLVSCVTVYVGFSWAYPNFRMADAKLAAFLAFVVPVLIGLPCAYTYFNLMRTVGNAVSKLEDFVKFDGLTGVLSRTYFMESMRARFSEGGALFLVDADHFKAVNDTYGHDVGDEALKVIGQTMNAVVGADDLVGRIGGEEFAIFFPGMPASDIETKAEALKTRMAEAGKIVAGQSLGLTISIGIAEVVKGSTLTILFKQADDNLYMAKKSGRNCYIYADNARAAVDDNLQAMATKAA